MQNSESAGMEHLEEGTLLRYLDSEVTGAERSEIAAHLLRCRACARLLARLRTDRELFSEMLAEIPVPEPDSAQRAASWARVQGAAERKAAGQPNRRVLLRVAAAALILIGSTTLVSPVRAWVVDFWHDTAGHLGRFAGIAESPTLPEPIAMRNATIGFVPSGESFTVRIQSTQRTGTLLLGVAEGASVTANVVGTDEAIDFVILPDGIRIDNQESDSADYALRLPSGLRQIRVQVGRAPEIVYSIDELSASWVSVLDLTQAGQ